MARRSHQTRSFTAILAAVPFAAFCAVFFWNGTPQAAALPVPSASDTETAQFGQCIGGHRVTCVVDGDTFWYSAVKIRIADINTPETSSPGCAHEAELGHRATLRLTELLNAGPFSLWPADRAYDKYGRRLLVVKRGGRSLGDTLVAEGLAERWQGYRRNWCTG
jgi:endonuclease YncB( thermonuclease family)